MHKDTRKKNLMKKLLPCFMVLAFALLICQFDTSEVWSQNPPNIDLPDPPSEPPQGGDVPTGDDTGSGDSGRPGRSGRNNRGGETGDEQAQAPGENTAIRGGQKVETVKRKARSAGPSSVKGKEVPPEIKFPLKAIEASLHFSPMDLNVLPGKEFEVELMLSNSANKPVRRFIIDIEYDPNWLEFLSYDSAPIRPYLGEAPDKGLQLEKEKGRLLFSAELDKSVSLQATRIAVLKFKTAENAGISSLKFNFAPEGKTEVLAGGENIVVSSSGELRGALDMQIFISEALDNIFMPFTDMQSTTTRVDYGMNWTESDENLSDVEMQAKKNWTLQPQDVRVNDTAMISLQGPQMRNVMAGDTFWVDLVLWNPNLAPIDSLGARVEFDPQVLEVVDQDQENWITRGINAWDGAFHKNYPFDFHQFNMANNNQGYLRYQAGRQYGPWQFPSGIFARIQFRAKAPTKQAVVRLARFNEFHPHTYVRSYGIDRMADVWEDKGNPAIRVMITDSGLALVE